MLDVVAKVKERWCSFTVLLIYDRLGGLFLGSN